MALFVEPFDFAVHNQSTECFVVLCCHNTFAKSYGSKVGLIFKNVAFLLPFLMHSSYRFRCTTVTIYIALWLPFLLHFSIPVTEVREQLIKGHSMPIHDVFVLNVPIVQQH